MTLTILNTKLRFFFKTINESKYGQIHCTINPYSKVDYNNSFIQNLISQETQMILFTHCYRRIIKLDYILFCINK